MKLYFFLFIEFIGVTLVNKIIQVSGAQFYNISFVQSTVCSPPQVKSPSITIHLPHPLLYYPHFSPQKSPHCCTCPWPFSLFSFLLNPFIPSSPPTPHHSRQPAIYESVSTVIQLASKTWLIHRICLSLGNLWHLKHL